MKAVVSILFILLLSGCATPSSAPNETAQAASKSVLKNRSFKNGGFHDRLTFTAIDGVPLKRGAFGSIPSEIVVSPGLHSVHFILERSSKGGVSGALMSMGGLSFESEEGGVYVLNSDSSQPNAVVWIENERTGKRVSEVSTTDFDFNRRGGGTMIPIFIPVK